MQQVLVRRLLTIAVVAPYRPGLWVQGVHGPVLPWAERASSAHQKTGPVPSVRRSALLPGALVGLRCPHTGGWPGPGWQRGLGGFGFLFLMCVCVFFFFNRAGVL